MTSAGYALGLIGYPLEHSLSPLLHAAALKSSGLEGEYRLYPAPPTPQGLEIIQSLLRRMRQGEIQGLNLTIPHKRTVLGLLDELTPTAGAIGAVNTIYLKDGRLVGDNTDVAGFWTDLCSQLTVGNPSSKEPPGTALVLGAGGSARAVVCALIQGGWEVCIATRRREQAEEMVSALGTQMGFGAPSPEAIFRRSNGGATLSLEAGALTGMLSQTRVSLIVNTTPLGMGVHADECAWPLEVPFPREAFVYDLVYNPPETRLLRAAKSAGLPAANGLGMLIEQAALAFLAWTGVSPSRAVLREALG